MTDNEKHYNLAMHNVYLSDEHPFDEARCEAVFSTFRSNCDHLSNDANDPS